VPKRLSLFASLRVLHELEVNVSLDLVEKDLELLREKGDRFEKNSVVKGLMLSCREA
jgi:hypothetical protein